MARLKHPRQKGYVVRKRCREILEQSGYLVDTVEKTGKFVKQKDMYGIVDIAALKHDEIKFVQVTSSKPHTHKPYKEFSIRFPLVNLEQWCWIRRKGFIVYQYNKGIINRFKLFNA